MSTPAHFLQEPVGSMSQGAAGNPTVAMIEAAFAHHGLPWRYINMEVTPDDLGAAVRGARAMGVQYWTGIEPDVAVMRQALEKALGL